MFYIDKNDTGTFTPITRVQLYKVYQAEVDKTEYQDFRAWLCDMFRSYIVIANSPAAIIRERNKSK